MENLNLQSEHMKGDWMEEYISNFTYFFLFLQKVLFCYWQSVTKECVVKNKTSLIDVFSFSSQGSHMENLHVQFDVYLLNAYCV